MKYCITASQLSGSIKIPPSKSHTMRAILFASLAYGKSVIHHYLPSPDTQAMMHACRLLGAKILIDAQTLTIEGINGKPNLPNDVVDAGNSGQVLRFIAAIAALINGYTIITGDDSIRHNRPVQPLISAIQQLGGFAVSSKNDGYAPLIIKGPIHAGYAELEGKDSQPVSALLIACSFLQGASEIKVNDSGEKSWVNLTLHWFDRLGISYTHDNYERYFIKGFAQFEGFEYRVPGDFSSAAFPLAAALLTHSEIQLENIDMSDVQGDKALIPVLQRMGARFDYDEKNRVLTVKKYVSLTGGTIDANDFIDAVPILAVIGSFCENALHIRGAEIAQLKESNRLETISAELSKMQANITVFEDGLIIEPALLKGNKTFSHQDHRIAMALAVAGLAADGETGVDEIRCVEKSFPEFAKNMRTLGAHILESV